MVIYQSTETVKLDLMMPLDEKFRDFIIHPDGVYKHLHLGHLFDVFVQSYLQ